MTQSELDTFYKNFIKDQKASDIAKHIYNIVSDAVTGGIVRDFNRAEYGPDVRDGITKLTMLIRAYNDLVQAAASKVPADVSSRLASIETSVSELEAMGIANSPNAHGEYSHSEGDDTDAFGDASHAEGTGTRASGMSSHAEGSGNMAVGDYSHAEGSGNSVTAQGESAHAEGTATRAEGRASHTEGRGTIAKGEAQHVQGKYNIEDTTSAFIIGNGTDDSHRSNAASIDWEGNAIFAGDVDSGAVNSFAFNKWVIRSTGFVKLPMATEEYARMLHIFVEIGSDNKHYGGVLKCVNGKPIFEYDEIT